MKNLARVLFITFLSLSLIGTGIAFGENIVIKGSTTVLPVAQATAEAFIAANPEINISISGGGSGNGIKALVDKSTDIANASRFIKDKEVKLAQDNGIYPVPVSYTHLTLPTN